MKDSHATDWPNMKDLPQGLLCQNYYAHGASPLLTTSKDARTHACTHAQARAHRRTRTRTDARTHARARRCARAHETRTRAHARNSELEGLKAEFPW